MPVVLPTFPGEGYSYDPKSTPPPYGRALKKYFAFDDDFVNLNHGSFGSQPLPVVADSLKYILASEQNPDKFHRIDYFLLMTESRQLVADLIGAKLNEVVLVPNATHGLNTILRNFEWREGDSIIYMSTTYVAITKTLQYLADRPEQSRPTLHELILTFPMTHTEIIDAFRVRIRELKQAHSHVEFTDTPNSEPGHGKNKFVAVIDSIVSNPGVLLPWQELVKVCAEEGVWSVVDAAHSIGQEVNINLSESKPDFWVTSIHKWLFVKRGCAILYVPERNQHIIKTSLPTSHMYREKGSLWRSTEAPPSFVAQHECTGTQDISPFFTIKPALDFRNWLGGEVKLNAYCHDLAIQGGKRLAEILNTQLLDESGELTVNMTNVLLPLPASPSPIVYTPEIIDHVDTLLRNKLLYDWNTYVAHYFYDGRWWVRASAQVWSEISDFEYLGKALVQICKEVKEEVFRKSKL